MIILLVANFFLTGPPPDIWEGSPYCEFGWQRKDARAIKKALFHENREQYLPQAFLSQINNIWDNFIVGIFFLTCDIRLLKNVALMH